MGYLCVVLRWLDEDWGLHSLRVCWQLGKAHCIFILGRLSSCGAVYMERLKKERISSLCLLMTTILLGLEMGQLILELCESGSLDWKVCRREAYFSLLLSLLAERVLMHGWHLNWLLLEDSLDGIMEVTRLLWPPQVRVLGFPLLALELELDLWATRYHTPL